jgi:long-chain fatty acid transport protein
LTNFSEIITNFAVSNKTIIYFMKKFFLMLTMASATLVAEAGGLMTNTNYHIAFDRMFARGATTEIDAAYSNPAGLAWGHEGLQLSLNFQKPWQNRDIETDIPNFLMAGNNFYQKYNGKASAPIVPALFASYKQDRWAVSTMIGIVGSGGFVKYDEGVPMFTVPITTMLAQKGVMPGTYAMDAQMEGKQYIYGGQLNFTYKLTDFLSAAVGMRANYYDGYNRGHVLANMGGTELVSLQLDCLQKGWGFAPIVSVDFHQGPLTVAARYEFRTKINTENDTKELSATVTGMTPAQVAAAFGEKTAPYMDGVKTRYDMPSLLTVAAQYEITPKLRAAAEYHFFDDKNAKMAGNRQDELKHGTHEVLLGAEYDVNDKFTVSLGGQRTDYGLSDNYQTHTSFACDSYSLGCGAAVNLNEKIRLNASYFCTLYSDYKKEQANYQGLPFAGSDTFSRTNHVIGLGIDYKF